MLYEYPSGVLDEERPIVEKFENEIVPYVRKYGGYIGEAAMRGDLDAEEVIRRYSLFVNGMPMWRDVNLKLCTAALKRWEKKRLN